MMMPQQLDTLVSNLRRFEGAVNHMYLDTHDPPLVTVGIGVMLPTVGDAVALPFVNASIGRGATESEVAQAYARVRAMRCGMGTSYYQGVTDIELPASEVTALAVRRLDAVFLPGLRDLYLHFEAMPFAAQEVLVDLAWNAGLAGLSKFHRLAASVAARDWITAANETHMATSRPARNEWRRDTMLSARDA